MRFWTVLGAMSLVACGGGNGGETSSTPSSSTTLDPTTYSSPSTGSLTTTPSTTDLPSVPLLGDGDASKLSFQVVATQADDLLSMPSDIDFHPDQGSAWITLRDANAIVVLTAPGTPEQASSFHSGPASEHFLAKPSALAFSSTGDFATIHEEDELTQGVGGTPADFMGPTLWTGALWQFEGGHASHLDMLHNSPNGVGIASAGGNAYWVFDGWHNSITFYNFREDHDLGGAYHGDGQIIRYAEGNVAYVEGVGSHLVYDDLNNLVYIADSGNNRIAVLDPNDATIGGPLDKNYDGLGPGDFNYATGAAIYTVVDGVAAGLEMPSGLEIHEGLLYVGDHATGMIHAFTLDGTWITGVDTGVGAGSLQGFDIFDGAIWFTDEADAQVVRMAPAQ